MPATWPTLPSGPASPTTASAPSIPATTCRSRPGPGWRRAAMTWGRFAGCSRPSGTPRAGTPTPSRISAARRPPNRTGAGLRDGWRGTCAQARQTATSELAAWTARWAAFADTAGALAGALERIGEAGAASLTEVFDGRTAERPDRRDHYLREPPDRTARPPGAADGPARRTRRDRRRERRRAARQRSAPRQPRRQAGRPAVAAHPVRGRPR